MSLALIRMPLLILEMKGKEDALRSLSNKWMKSWAG
jgi:hypothetical protein